MLEAIYATPAWLFLIGACACATAIACAGQVWVHRRFRSIDFVRHNEVGGFMITVVGTLFAVTLAFVTVVVWEEYDGSKERVSVEASDASIVWHMAGGLSPALDASLRADMAAYAHTMITDDWPAMRLGRFSDRGEDILTRAISALVRYHPKDPGSSNVQVTLLARLSDLHDVRRHRYQDNASGLSGFQWTVIFLGALVLLIFCYLFGLQNERVHLVMTSAVAIIVSSMFVLIVELDYPFRGDLSISPEPWASFIDRMEREELRAPPSHPAAFSRSEHTAAVRARPCEVRV